MIKGEEMARDVLSEALDYAKMDVGSKAELFLRLCSLNYLNSMIKIPEFKQRINYGMIKPKALQLVIDLEKSEKTTLCEEIFADGKGDF